MKKEGFHLLRYLDLNPSLSSRLMNLDPQSYELWRDILLSPVYCEYLVELVVDEEHCVLLVFTKLYRLRPNMM